MQEGKLHENLRTPDGQGVRTEHSIVIGDSDSGKSTELRKWHKECPDVSLFVNFADTGGVSGPQAATEKGMRSALDHFKEIRHARVNIKGEAEPAVLYGRAVNFAVEVREEYGNAVQIIADESSHLWDWPEDKEAKKSNNPAAWVLREGRDKGIKGVFADQKHPTSKPVVDHLAQARWWCWVGPPAGLHEGMLRYHTWIPREDLPDRRFEIVTFSKRGIPVWRGETDPEYA